MPTLNWTDKEPAVMGNYCKSAGRWLLACFLVVLPPVTAADEDAMIALVGRCVACHGADGIGKSSQYPNLQGQRAAYLEKQVKAYRSGERKDPWMSAMARTLSDAEIASVAAWFAAAN